MPGIGIIVNATTRRHRRDPGLPSRLAQRLGDDGVVRTTHSRTELSDVAAEFLDHGVDVLGIVGGDGTAHVSLSEILAVYGDRPLPTVALLRGGTMNTVAGSLGTPRESPDRLLGRLLDRYRSGADETRRASLRPSECRLMRVERRAGGAPSYGFLFGTGVIRGFLAQYYATGHPSPFTAVATLAGGVRGALSHDPAFLRMTAPFRGDAQVDEEPPWPERDYLAIAAGTIPHIGLGFRPFYRCRDASDAFHALGIVTSAATFVRELPRIYRGAPMRPGSAYDVLSRRMTVRATGGVVEYMIDGDLHQAEGEVVVTIGPRIFVTTLRG